MYQPYYFFMSCYYTLYWASEGCHPRKIDFDGGPLILTRLETIKGIFRRNNSRAWFKIDDYQYSDEEIEDNFKNRLRKKLSKIEEIDWDIFYIGINDRQLGRQGKFVSRIEGIYCPDNILWGTHAYLIKRKSVLKIIDWLTPINYPIDHCLMLLDIKRLTLINPLVKAYNHDSDTA